VSFDNSSRSLDLRISTGYKWNLPHLGFLDLGKGSQLTLGFVVDGILVSGMVGV